MTFPHSDCPLRSDHSFRTRLEPGHHRENSIIERLPIDMVKDFVIADSLHLLELGAMRRLINIWKDGLRGYQEKWNKRDILELNQSLGECNKRLPKEIHRRFRFLEKLSFWNCCVQKGLEFQRICAFRNTFRSNNYLYYQILSTSFAISSSTVQ